MAPTRELRRDYGDFVHFALVYVVDPHPLAPDVSPYSGLVWQLGFSKFRQARSFGERVRYANNVSAAGSFDVILADGLSPGGKVHHFGEYVADRPSSDRHHSATRKEPEETPPEWRYS